MKKIIGVIAVLLAIGFSGCKKAETEPVYYCKNTCYVCYGSNNPSSHDTICNTDFYTEVYFQEMLQDFSVIGFICKEIHPSTFNEIRGINIQTQIDSQQANRLTCYNKDSFHPQYFDYPAFYAAYIERKERCTECYDSIAQRYLDIYLDSLDSYVGGFANCPECLNTTYCYDTLMPYAVAKVNVMGMHCGITTGPLFSMPNYMASYLRLRQFEPVSPTFTQEEKDDIIALNSWLDFNPRAQDGINHAAIFRNCP